MEFHYFYLSPPVFFTVLPLYLDTLYQCVGVEISDLLTLSLNIRTTVVFSAAIGASNII